MNIPESIDVAVEGWFSDLFKPKKRDVRQRHDESSYRPTLAPPKKAPRVRLNLGDKDFKCMDDIDLSKLFDKVIGRKTAVSKLKKIYRDIVNDAKLLDTSIKNNVAPEEWLALYYKSGIDTRIEDEWLDESTLRYNGNILMVTVAPIGFDMCGVIPRDEQGDVFDFYWGPNNDKSGIEDRFTKYFESVGFYVAYISWTGDNDGGSSLFYLAKDKNLAKIIKSEAKDEDDFVGLFEIDELFSED